MAKIYVPPVLPNEQGRIIESSGDKLVPIRTWPDGTQEFDRGGVGVFIGPPTDHVTGRKQTWDEVGKEIKDAIVRNKMAGDFNKASVGSITHGEAGVKVPVRDVEAGLRKLGLYDGPLKNGQEDGVWGQKANGGLEKLLIMVQKENNLAITGSYNEETAKALQEMAKQGRIDQKLVDGLKDMNDAKQLSSLYIPRNVIGLLDEIDRNGEKLPLGVATATAGTPTPPLKAPPEPVRP